MSREEVYMGDMVPHDESFVINFGSKNLRPIRISLPKPPPLHLIPNYGLPREEQVFKRIPFPKKLVQLEEEVYEYYKEKKAVTNLDIRELFWKLLRQRKKALAKEIRWMKHFIWFMHNGYWVFIDGKPTYLSPWHFSYLHLHWMTLDKGEGYPTYDDRQRIQFLWRHYTYTTTETFADLDENGKAYKVDGKYRMKDMGQRTILGEALPKSRRLGATNEFCHIIKRIMTETYGADNLGTIVSMDGNNASVHFKKKLVPAYKKWPVWLKPIWSGGVTSIEFSPGKGVMNPNIKYLGSSIDYTESGGDVANDGKKLMAGGFDEQGKGKRIGNVQNRWQINKETMTLQAGNQILGWCSHPSTVEKMDEGGIDYKALCDLSDFYTRTIGGQTLSGLALGYMPSSYCLRGFTDKFGKPVLLRPTERQKALGYKPEIGSKTYLERRRNLLYDESDPKKMDEYRSFVRKFPEDYDDCWKGVAGYIGFPIEHIEDRIIELRNNPEEVQGRFEWVDNRRFGRVEFIPDPEGDWTVAKIIHDNSDSRKSKMEYFSAFHNDDIEQYRPAEVKGIIGVDPHEFNNESDSRRLGKNGSRLSDTGMAVIGLRDRDIDQDDFDKQSWKTVKTWAVLEKRFSNNEAVAEEALKAAIYYNCLMHIETNKTEVLSRIVEWRFGGYLNHMAQTMPFEEIEVDRQPGSKMNPTNKKKMFSLAKDHFVHHVKNESISLILKQAMEISSMEQLTAYDAFAAWLNAIYGSTSLYHLIMDHNRDDGDVTRINAYGRAV